MLHISVSQQGRSTLLWYTKCTVFIASFSGSCFRIFFSTPKPRTEVWVGKAKEVLLWFFFFCFVLFLFARVCFIYTHIFVVSMDFSFVVSIRLKFAVLMQACPTMAVSMSWKSLGSHTLTQTPPATHSGRFLPLLRASRGSVVPAVHLCSVPSCLWGIQPWKFLFFRGLSACRVLHSQNHHARFLLFSK